MAVPQKSKNVVRNKPHYPRGHVGDGSDVARAVAWFGGFIILVLILIALNMPG